ncbi:hypothetical protein FH972_014167 [Carpinus fangiana]|uniref:Protein kinase domain-containing protein n=1 Tax=Carpinus fangiana TaxID=176857 RepID=A0A5N6RCC4_9ROSI|nr:hypothetical protein FH972_014167 [Carpinus fangiana]
MRMEMFQFYCFFSLLLLALSVEAQQIYVNNKQLDCYNDRNFTDGYACNGVQTSCQAYLTFRSNPPYNSPATIGLLLGPQPSLVADANNMSSFDTIPADTQILIPINNCSCSGPYYQHNTSYKLSSKSETYLLPEISDFQRRQVPQQRPLRFGAAVEGSERVELAMGEHTVPGQRRAVIELSHSQVDPKVAILGNPEGAEAIGEARGGVPMGVGVGVGFRLVAEIEKVEDNSVGGLFLLEVVAEVGVDGGEGDGEERRAGGKKGFRRFGRRGFGRGELRVGREVPLRCACPTRNQKAAGVKYLLTYMITWNDDISSIAQLFGVDKQSVLDANELTDQTIIFPFTPILVPLKSKPTLIQKSVSPSTTPPPPPPTTTNTGSGNNNKRWVFVGVAVGASALLVLSTFLLWFFYRRRHSHKEAPKPIPPALSLPTNKPSPSHSQNSWTFSTQEVRYTVESLTLYKFDDLQKATGFFGEANRIKGSVYRGSFMGDDAAVKVMKGDVSSEINLLKRINHSNIIRLSGFCVHGGNTYLVYEYTENGSLTDWLGNKYPGSSPLAWKQRVQVAYDVADALNYLHNYTNPPYIHKNLKTSNILLDSSFRAKISNFGLARTLENQEDGFQLTRHVVGTQGYMAPEYIENGVITPKLDVFAFGVVMLELLSGREATAADKHGGDDDELLYASIRRVLEGNNVREKLRGFVDPSLRHEYPLDLAFSMAQLAKSCVAHDLNSRPAMPEVLMTLSKILSSSLDWDPSDELERSRSVGHTNGR